MDLPKVNIILSTYNGEKSIQQQLDSLFEQDYTNIDIYVRDDGSTDATINILEQYRQQGKIHLIKGNNCGFCQSFLQLLAHVDTGKYWSFCDQDDIWKKDKISRAVESLEKQESVADLPILYYSYSNMIDEEGNYLGIQKPPLGSLCFRRALTGTFGVGFCMVINKALRDAMLCCNSAKIHAHDWLAGAIALGFGKIIIDEYICADYRRLRTSTTRVTFGKKVRWFFNMMANQGDVKERNLEFSRCFFDKLSPENQKLMSLFDREHYSLYASIKKCFYPKRWRPSLSSELSMRLLMILGKV